MAGLNIKTTSLLHHHYTLPNWFWQHQNISKNYAHLLALLSYYGRCSPGAKLDI